MRKGSLKSYFYTGLLSMLPIILTVYIFNTIFQFIFSLISRSFISVTLKEMLLEIHRAPNGIIVTKSMTNSIINVLTIVIVITILTIVGYTLNHVFFNKIVNRVKKMFEKAPVIKYIYTTVSQLVSLVSSDKALSYKKVAAVEYPRKGIYSIGFITAERNPLMEVHLNDEEVYNIFIPTSPNPTSGMFVVIPKSEAIILDIKVDDAIKLIISGGAIVPKFNEEEEKKVCD
ncbi:MAG: DUF502 domain-containing protein [Fusobacteriaceae bacterium]